VDEELLAGARQAQQRMIDAERDRPARFGA
jgi:hypothetical protein